MILHGAIGDFLGREEIRGVELRDLVAEGLLGKFGVSPLFGTFVAMQADSPDG